MFKKINTSFEVSAPFQVVFLLISPALATYILKEHNKENRKPHSRNVRQLSRAMIGGHFMTTHQGLAFDTNGRLVDGQHRLLAIIASNTTQMMMVSYGVQPKTMGGVDGGDKRTTAELITLGEGLQTTRRETAIVHRIVAMGGRVDLIPSEYAALLREHEAAIAFAVAACNEKRFNAAATAVVARAYYTVTADQLKRFVWVACGNDFQPHERAAAAFGRLTKKSLKEDGFNLTQRALLCFIHGDPKAFIRPLAGNHFPLPGEEADPRPTDVRRSPLPATASAKPAPIGFLAGTGDGPQYVQ